MNARRSRNLAPALLGIGLLLIFAIFVYGVRTWEWGFLDDLQFVARSKEFTTRFGLWRGILENTRGHMNGDRTWGLFRPGFSLYSSAIYLLPANLAYFTRFLTFAGSIAFALLTVARLLQNAQLKPGRIFYTLLLVTILAIHPLYDALGFISLQEYCGLFFAALGLFFFIGKQQCRRSAWCAVFCFLLASSFKTPFVWLLLGAGLLAVFSRHDFGLGIFCAITALLNIGIAANYAKSGAYTSQFTEFKLGLIEGTLFNFFKQAALPALVILSTAAAGWRSEKRRIYPTDWYAAMLLGAGFMYLANLLPWGSPNYHMGPPIFFLVLGAFTYLAPRFKFKPARLGYPTAAAFLSILLCVHGLWKAIARDTTIQNMRDFALQQPMQGLVLATNGIESAGRFRELLVMRSGGAWKNQIVCGTENTAGLQEGGETINASPDFYFVFSDQGGGNPRYMTKLVATFPLAKVYQVK